MDPAIIFVISYMLGKVYCQTFQNCGNYIHGYESSQDGKMFSRWLLWTKTVNLTAQCAIHCQADSSCVSFQVDLTGNSCRGYGVTFNINSPHVTGTGYKFYETEAAEGYIGSSCQENTDCSLTDSVCVNDECMCDPGLAFSAKQKACVSTCASYGNEYSEILGYYIGGNNMATYNGVTTQQCKDNCTATTAFLCRSADYRTSDGRCDLTSQTLKTVSASNYRTENDITIITCYSRDCEK